MSTQKSIFRTASFRRHDENGYFDYGQGLIFCNYISLGMDNSPKDNCEGYRP